ncbi:hypothetical protein BH11PSE8_BH11PSE8_26940 [soil metagenome]
MRVNMFEGARRISLALGVLWVGGCVAYAVFAEPYASMTFAVSGPGERPVRAEECGRDDATHYISARTLAGKSIGVTLCFTAHKADDGRMLVPYAIKTVSVRMPDGTTVENVPEGLSRADLLARLKKSGYDTSKLDAAAASAPAGRASEPLWKQAPEAPARLRYWTMGERYATDVTSYAQGVGAGFAMSAEDAREAEKRLWDARLRQWKEAAQVMFGGLVIGWLLIAVVGWIVRGFLGIPRGKDSRPLPPDGGRGDGI